MKPTVVNFASDENAAGAKDTKGFGEHLILELCGFQVVQDEDGESRREGLGRERQVRCIATHCGGYSIDL
jgi:hypothetical protein